MPSPLIWVVVTPLNASHRRTYPAIPERLQLGDEGRLTGTAVGRQAPKSCAPAAGSAIGPQPHDASLADARVLVWKGGSDAFAIGFHAREPSRAGSLVS